MLIGSCIVGKEHTSTENYFKLSEQTEKIKIAELKLIRNFELPIENPKYNVPNDEQILETDTGTFLILTFHNYSKIFVYDLEKEKKVDEIPLSKPDLRSFYYLNPDTIFLFYSPHSNLYYNHDSSLVMINQKGKIKKAYSWKDAPVWCTEKERTYEDSISYAFLYFQKLAYSHGKIMMPFIASSQKMFGDSLFITDKRANVGLFDTKADKFTPLQQVPYPALTGKFYYPYTMRQKLLCTTHNEEFLISYQYTPEMYHYSQKTNKIDKVCLKSTVLDSILPFYEPEIPAGYKVPEYFGIRYDKYRNNYIRYVAFQPIYGKGTFIVADTNFNFVAEGMHPKGTGTFVFSEKYILAYNMQATSQAEGKIVFSAYELGYRNGTNQELIKKLKAENQKNQENRNNLAKFYKNELYIEEKNYTVTTIVWQTLCHSTVDFVLRHYQANEKGYKNNNVYLVVATDNPEQVKAELTQDYSLNPDSLSNILLVSSAKYLPYHTFSEMAPRISIVRNNKLVSDTIYVAPTQITEDMQDILLESAEEQENLK